jgi:hypothetical protein
MAVFFTPAMISGILSMKYSLLVAWKFVVGAVYVLSVGSAACGTGNRAGTAYSSFAPGGPSPLRG